MSNQDCYETRKGTAELLAKVRTAYVPVSLKEDYLTRMAQANLLTSSQQPSKISPVYLGTEAQLRSSGEQGYLDANSQNYQSCCH